MSQVYNESFHVGDRFRGQVDGKVYVVEKVSRKGDPVQGQYSSWPEKSDMVYLRCEDGGKECRIPLQTARCMLFERLV